MYNLDLEGKVSSNALPPYLCDQTVYLYKWKVRFFTLHRWVEQKVPLVLPIVIFLSHVMHLGFKRQRNIPIANPIAKKIDFAMLTLRNASLVISSLCLAMMGIGTVVKKVTAVSQSDYMAYRDRYRSQLGVNLGSALRTNASNLAAQRPTVQSAAAVQIRPAASTARPIGTPLQSELRQKMVAAYALIREEKFSEAACVIKEIEGLMGKDQLPSTTLLKTLLGKCRDTFHFLLRNNKPIPKDLHLLLACYSEYDREAYKKEYLTAHSSQNEREGFWNTQRQELNIPLFEV